MSGKCWWYQNGRSRYYGISGLTALEVGDVNLGQIAVSYCLIIVQACLLSIPGGRCLTVTWVGDISIRSFLLAVHSTCMM